MIRKAALSRRNVMLGLAGAGAVGIAAAATPAGKLLRSGVGTLTGRTPPRRVPLALAGYAEWLRAVGGIFTIEGGYDLRLAGVRMVGASAGRAAVRGVRTYAFTATFEVLAGKTMAGDLIYTARYGAERFPLFLSATAAPSRMQAMFG